MLPTSQSLDAESLIPNLSKRNPESPNRSPSTQCQTLNTTYPTGCQYSAQKGKKKKKALFNDGFLRNDSHSNGKQNDFFCPLESSWGPTEPTKSLENKTVAECSSQVLTATRPFFWKSNGRKKKWPKETKSLFFGFSVLAKKPFLVGSDLEK